MKGLIFGLGTSSVLLVNGVSKSNTTEGERQYTADDFGGSVSAQADMNGDWSKNWINGYKYYIYKDPSGVGKTHSEAWNMCNAKVVPPEQAVAHTGGQPGLLAPADSLEKVGYLRSAWASLIGGNAPAAYDKMWIGQTNKIECDGQTARDWHVAKYSHQTLVCEVDSNGDVPGVDNLWHPEEQIASTADYSTTEDKCAYQMGLNLNTGDKNHGWRRAPCTEKFPAFACATEMKCTAETKQCPGTVKPFATPWTVKRVSRNNCDFELCDGYQLGLVYTLQLKMPTDWIRRISGVDKDAYDTYDELEGELKKAGLAAVLAVPEWAKQANADFDMNDVVVQEYAGVQSACDVYALSREKCTTDHTQAAANSTAELVDTQIQVDYAFRVWGPNLQTTAQNMYDTFQVPYDQSPFLQDLDAKIRAEIEKTNKDEFSYRYQYYNVKAPADDKTDSSAKSVFSMMMVAILFSCSLYL